MPSTSTNLGLSIIEPFGLRAVAVAGRAAKPTTDVFKKDLLFDVIFTPFLNEVFRLALLFLKRQPVVDFGAILRAWLLPGNIVQGVPPGGA